MYAFTQGMHMIYGIEGTFLKKHVLYTTLIISSLVKKI